MSLSLYFLSWVVILWTLNSAFICLFCFSKSFSFFASSFLLSLLLKYQSWNASFEPFILPPPTVNTISLTAKLSSSSLSRFIALDASTLPPADVYLSTADLTKPVDSSPLGDINWAPAASFKDKLFLPSSPISVFGVVSFASTPYKLP